MKIFRPASYPKRYFPMKTIKHDDLVLRLKDEFPVIIEELEDEAWTGLLHFEVSCLARHTQQQIDEGNKKELTRCFESARQFMLYGDEKVKNAMYVSYLEHLDFRDGRHRRQWAMKLMPQPLAKGYREIHEYLDTLGK